MAITQTQLVSETVLDRGVFLPYARQVTDKNHAAEVDARPGQSRVMDDIAILDSFGKCNWSGGVCQLGFMVAARAGYVDDVLQICSGMPHVVAHQYNTMLKVVVVTGSVSQWSYLCKEWCNKYSRVHVREVFTDVYHAICKKGLVSEFQGFTRANHDDGSVLLIGHS